MVWSSIDKFTFMFWALHHPVPTVRPLVVRWWTLMELPLTCQPHEVPIGFRMQPEGLSIRLLLSPE